MGLIVAIHFAYLVAVLVALWLLSRLSTKQSPSCYPSYMAVLGCVLLSPGLYVGNHALLPTFAFLAIIAHLVFSTFEWAILGLQLGTAVAPIIFCWLVALVVTKRAHRRTRASAE